MTYEFQPGDVVYATTIRRPMVVRAVDGDDVWVRWREHPDSRGFVAPRIYLYPTPQRPTLNMGGGWAPIYRNGDVGSPNYETRDDVLDDQEYCIGAVRLILDMDSVVWRDER